MASFKVPSHPEAGCSFVGSKICLSGNLKFSGNLLLDGKFQGDIEGDGLLELGSKAETEGKIAADELIHRGQSEGDLVVVKRIEMLPGCLHRGDIQARRVKISPLASLEGSLKMPDASPDIPPDPVAGRRRIRRVASIVFILLTGTAITKLSMQSPPIWETLKSNIHEYMKKGIEPFRRLGLSNSSNGEEDILQKNLLNEASQLQKEGKNVEALKILQTAEEIAGKHTASASFRLAVLYVRLGKKVEAIQKLKELLEKVPAHMEGRILLGDIYASSGDLKNAAVAYSEAARRDPKDIVLKRRLAEIKARLKPNQLVAETKPTNLSPEVFLRNAERLLVEKKAVQASKILQDGIEKYPDNARLYFQLGSALAQMAERNSAINAYKKVIELTPDWQDAYVRLGALLEAGRRDKDAIDLYKKAASLDPANVEMLVRIPRLLKRRGREEEAHQMLLQLQKDYPRSTIVLVELGNLLWETGKAESAKKVFQKVLKITPDSAPALNRLAWFHAMEMKNLERGIELSKQSLEISPDTPPYLDTLAELYYRSGEAVKAIPLIQRAIELDPSNRYYRVQLDKFKRASQ